MLCVVSVSCVETDDERVYDVRIPFDDEGRRHLLAAPLTSATLPLMNDFA